MSRNEHFQRNKMPLSSKTVLVGVPVYNDEKTIAQCINSIVCQSQRLGVIKEILVVASGCTDGTVAILRRFQESEPKLQIVEEKTRRGKASALNIIFSRFNGGAYDYLVVTNGDAVLEQNALDKLIEHAEGSKARLVCGSPVPAYSSQASIRRISGFIWDLHNRFLELGPHFSRPHCTDELMCFSRHINWSIPHYVVNDGAYLSLLLNRHGLRCQYCAEAVVKVYVPSSVRGLIRQRSRIILGHILLKKKFGSTSDTFEATALKRPNMALNTLVTQIRRHGVTAFTEAAVIEGIALFMAMIQSVSSSEPWIWERVNYAETRA